MIDQDKSKPVEVFSGSWMDAEILKTLLVDNDIKVYLYDEYIGAIAPWNAAGGGAAPVRVIVSDLDYEKARAVVKQFEANRE